MKLKEYFNEGKTDFWAKNPEYFIREVGKDTFAIAVFKRGDTPNAVYKVNCKKGTCTCPSKKVCKHIPVVQKWIDSGKPNYFGEDPKGDVLKKLKQMGVKI